MAKRRCAGKTKAGKPCRAAPLTDSDYCSAHDPTLPDGTRFGSPSQASEAGKLGGPATRHPRVVEVMRERVEANVERLLAPYFDAIDNAVVTATYEGVVIPSDVKDLAGRIAAVEKLLDRVYGRPRQVIQHAGAHDDMPVAVEVELGEEARKVLADVLRGRPATRS